MSSANSPRLALLKIADSSGQCAVKTDSVRTACLPPFQQMLPTGFYCEIAGYGRHQKGKMTRCMLS